MESRLEKRLPRRRSLPRKRLGGSFAFPGLPKDSSDQSPDHQRHRTRIPGGEKKNQGFFVFYKSGEYGKNYFRDLQLLKRCLEGEALKAIYTIHLTLPKKILKKMRTAYPLSPAIFSGPAFFLPLFLPLCYISLHHVKDLPAKHEIYYLDHGRRSRSALRGRFDRGSF